MERRVRELEFLPEDHLRAQFRRRIGFIRSWLLLAVGLAMVLWSLQVGAWVRNARAELVALQSTSSVVEADVAKVRMLRAEARVCNRRLNLVQTLHARPTVSAVFSDLAAILPDGVVLKEVVMACPDSAAAGRSMLRLQGVADRETTVTQMLAALEGSETLREASLVESKPCGREGPDRRAFVVEANLVPVSPAKEP
jgi:Tfp pilus assembly protein PilN